MNEIKKLEYQIVAPPDGNSAILEVRDQNGLDFIQVRATSHDDYEFRFLANSGDLTLTLKQIIEIIEKSKRNIEYIDNEHLT